MSHSKIFFTELRRRRVFNTVAIYIVGAWVALQVSDLAFPGLGIPEASDEAGGEKTGTDTLTDLEALFKK